MNERNSAYLQGAISVWVGCMVAWFIYLHFLS